MHEEMKIFPYPLYSIILECDCGVLSIDLGREWQKREFNALLGDDKDNVRSEANEIEAMGVDGVMETVSIGEGSGDSRTGARTREGSDCAR
jgi:hypothetical protein